MSRLVLLLVLAVSSTAHAIIIRHDVEDSEYRVPASEFPALADMPREGHGVLIAPQWIVTAAHTTPGHPDEITLNGVRRRVERLIVHPGYEELPDSLIAQAIKSGDASRAMEFQASNDTVLRRAYNTIIRTDRHWLVYRFDSGPSSHALEGMSGSGDIP